VLLNMLNLTWILTTYVKKILKQCHLQNVS
jgi:hypothetical protein